MPKLAPSIAPSIFPLAAIALSALLATGSAAAAPSTRLHVGGAVSSPTTYDLAGLQAKAPVTQTVTFQAGNASQTHTYTGTSLWGVLNDSGLVLNPNKNDVLNRYVLATGSDGYRTVFSLGELSPSFGNRPDLLAYAETIGNVTSPLTGDGFARVTAPGDVKGGRYVSNLVDLTVRSSGSTQGATDGKPTTSFSVSGGVTAPTTFSLASLEALTPTTEIVNGHSYTGVSFWDLLSSKVGIVLDPNVKNDVLDKYVVATGSDGYKSLFSLGELSSAFGNQPDLVAYEEDGQLLGTAGFARIVVPNDVKAGRWVSNLVNLEVFTAAPVPEPETWALMLLGMFAVAITARSRHRGR